jgi:hypothetical protein
MISSVPSERQRSALLGEHVVVTWQPMALAIWMPKVPVPPEPPLMKTLSPGLTLGAMTSAWCQFASAL